MPDSVKGNQICTLVIFGATGDLTHRKLIPALYHLKLEGLLSEKVQIIGFARQNKSDLEFRAGLKSAHKEVSRTLYDESFWQVFDKQISYHQSNFDDLDGYKSLESKIQAYEKGNGLPSNRLYYIASSPSFFGTILDFLKQSGANSSSDGGWRRVIIEKPFGTDYDSACRLNKVVAGSFEEADTYRIDHYLGKETAQNIMVLRFANAIYESLWNNRYIEQIQITVAEDLGMESGRGAYYDQAGALKDMVQNHLLQLLTLVAMESPVDLSADAVRDEKVKVLRSLQRLDTIEKVKKNTVRAQYVDGCVKGEPVPAYINEDRVPKDSKTETYVALRLFVDNWRWKGVPFYLRVGKRMTKKSAQISIFFKQVPQVLFNENQKLEENVLMIKMQPDEGVAMKLMSKVPGSSFELNPVNMNFDYETTFAKQSAEAYERLLLDTMSGDATLFIRKDEVEEAWKFVDDLAAIWKDESKAVDLATYEAGSWGPKEADDLAGKMKHKWLEI